MIITTKGLNVLALMDVNIEFVRAEIGNGELSGDPLTFTELISYKMDVQINNREFVDNETLCITISYRNDDVTEGFYVHETGLYIKDPEVETKEILFCYDHEADSNFLPDKTVPTGIEQVEKLYIKIGNTENISITLPSEGNILRADFGENTIFKSDIAEQPHTLTINEDSVIGRPNGGSIKSLTPNEFREIANKATNKSVLTGGVQVSNLTDGLIQSDSEGNISSIPVSTFGFMPVGSIIIWPLEVKPPGFLECNGASLLRATYSNLYDVIETFYGYSSDEYFYIPDYRGMFLRGWANGSVNDPNRDSRLYRLGTSITGDYVGTRQLSQNKSHRHKKVLSPYSPMAGNGTPQGTTTGQTVRNNYGDYSGGNQANPININVQFLIKY
ncbi:MAG: tail fiber protein [Desulfobacterales bacterium]|nr:tail fiber protein [Desulfobacterales bacterium]